MYALERVQRSFTGIVPRMEDFSIRVRMEKLGLFSLEQRKLSGGFDRDVWDYGRFG